MNLRNVTLKTRAHFAALRAALNGRIGFQRYLHRIGGGIVPPRLRAWSSIALALPLINDSDVVPTSWFNEVRTSLRGQLVYDVKQYGAVGDGIVDDAPAIQAAIDAAEANGGGTVHFPDGTYLYKSGLTVTDGVILAGSGPMRNSGVSARAAATLVKDGSFTGILVSGEGALLRDLAVDGAAGNTGAGIELTGGRPSLVRVSATNQGGVGVRLSDAAGANVNLFRLIDVTCLNNGSHGLHIHDGAGGAPNANAGLVLGYDGRDNTGDGLLVENAIDNTFIGVSCQLNTGIGVHLASGAKGNSVYQPYTESNTAGDFTLDAGADTNKVFGYRSGVGTDQITDNGAGNLILGHSSVNLTKLPYFRSKTAFENILIDNESVSGYWEASQEAVTRDLILALTGTSADASFVLKSASTGEVALSVNRLTVAESDATQAARIDRVRKAETTWDPGSVADGAAATTTVTFTDAVEQQALVLVSHSALTTAGVLLTGHVTDAPNGVVSVTLVNHSGSPFDLASGTLRVLVVETN